VIVIVSLVCLAAVAALGGWALQARARLGKVENRRRTAERENVRLTSLLQTAPASLYAWRPGGEEAAIGVAGSFDKFLGGLDPDTRARVERSVA
jgi:hypothetical protein